jgi:hypothetical protein
LPLQLGLWKLFAKLEEFAIQELVFCLLGLALCQVSGEMKFWLE